MASSKQLDILIALLMQCLIAYVVNAEDSSLNATATSEEPCPVSSSYCICSGEPFHNIHCKNISDLNTLSEIAANVTERTLILELNSLHLPHLSHEIFENTFLMTVIIKNSSFTRLFNSSELGNSNNSSNIHHLSLENVNISGWSWNQLSAMKKLDVVFAYNTTIGPNLTSSFSQEMSKSLKLLSIYGSNISSIERNSFKDLNNLTYLRISHSKLRTLSRNIFPMNSKIEQLKLDHNQIASLSADMFVNMTNISDVSLSNNRISSLPESTFRPLWKSEIHLELRNNPIKCDCRILWTVTSANKPQIIGKCSHPKKLHGRNIAELTQADLEC